MTRLSGFSAYTFILATASLLAPAWPTLGSGSAVSAPADSSLSVDVLSGAISRMVVHGTSVQVNVEIAPEGFQFQGTLASRANDADGVFNHSVTVTNNSGTYTLALQTSSGLAAGSYTGNVRISLCENASCSESEPVNSVMVPFTVDVVSPTSAWPGAHHTPIKPWPNVADWAMFQGNAAHTGFVPVSLDPDKFSTRWHTGVSTVPGQNGLLVASTATLGGRLFVSGNNHLYAINEFDGSPLWNYDFSTLEFPSVNPPAINNGVVYVAAGQQTSTYMFAFSASDGSPVFKSPMTSQWENYLSPAVGQSGVYTDAGEYGGLYAFTRSGTQRFFANEAQTSLWTPAVSEDGVYSYTGGVLQVVDPVTGVVTNSINDPTFTNYVYIIGGSPVLGASGMVFVANYANSRLNGGAIGNTLLGFSVTANSIAWQVPGCFPTTPAYANGILFVGDNNPVRLEARGAQSGKLIWSWVPPQAGDTGFISEVLLTYNLVFVSTNRATYAIDRTSHATVWSYPRSGKLSVSSAGIFYIQTADELYAFNVK
jgi:outer membrane protein assembly factor BamB